MLGYCLHIQDKYILDTGKWNLYIFFSAILVLISSEMIWFLTGSLVLMHNIYNLKDIDRYYEIFKKIEESPESYFDLNSVLELAKAMVFPSLFAILAALLSIYLGWTKQ